MGNKRKDISVWIEEEIKELMQFDINDAIYTGMEVERIAQGDETDTYKVSVELMGEVDVSFDLIADDDGNFYTVDLYESGMREYIGAAEIAAEMFYELIFQKEVLYRALFNKEEK